MIIKPVPIKKVLSLIEKKVIKIKKIQRKRQGQ